ncbi:MAG: sialidase family protein [Marinifilaceae bacterium]
MSNLKNWIYLFILFTISVGQVKADNGVVASTKKKAVWYQVISQASNKYCSGKMMSMVDGAMAYKPAAIDASSVWAFEQLSDSTYAIKQYGTGLYMKANVHEGFSTKPMPYTIKSAGVPNQYIISSVTEGPLHAQQSGNLMTHWEAGANSASAWNFVEVPTGQMTAPVALTFNSPVRKHHVSAPGEQNLPILGFSAHVDGFVGKEQVDKFRFTLNEDGKYLKNFRLYRTTMQKFNINEAELQNVQVQTEGNNVTFAYKKPQTLSVGGNYYWIVADVAPEAVEGATPDVTLSQVWNKKKQYTPNLKGEYPITVFLTKSVLFSPGDHGSKFYRIPAIETANDGSLVSVTDRRPYHNGDLPQAIDLYVRRSTDNGQTWSEPLMIAGEGDDKNGFGDAAIVKTKSGKLVVLFVGYKGLWDSSHDNPQRQFMCTSDDNGITWSKPVELTHFFYGPTSSNPDTKDWDAFFITSGRGLCTEDGHILFAIPTRVRGRQGLSVYTIGSADEGKTWKIMDIKAPATRAGDESKITQINDGQLIMSVRRHHKRDVVYGKIVNDEIVWEQPVRHEDLTDPFCNGEVMVYSSTNHGADKNRMIHSLCYAKNRSNVSVLLSYDEGKTFPIRKTICPSLSAYSTLCVLEDGTIGCYYEDGSHEMDIIFVRFSMDWLTDGKDKGLVK